MNSCTSAIILWRTKNSPNVTKKYSQLLSHYSIIKEKHIRVRSSINLLFSYVFLYITNSLWCDKMKSLAVASIIYIFPFKEIDEFLSYLHVRHSFTRKFNSQILCQGGWWVPMYWYFMRRLNNFINILPEFLFSLGKSFLFTILDSFPTKMPWITFLQSWNI